MSDDLRERVKAVEGINVSAVCQQALEAELRHHQALDGLDEGMDRVDVRTADAGAVTFVGRTLHVQEWGDGELRVWLTRRHRLALHWTGEDGGVLEDFDDLAALAAEWTDHEPAMVTAVADAIDRRHAVELDI